MKDPDTSFIMFCAFRYALGRMTYAVGIVSEYIIRHWDDLDRRDKVNMHREIREAIEKGEAGMDMDVKEWKRVLELKI